ncbi:MAG: ATP-binding cassette domain-containing protein [Prolixibacteraceae bacterium]|nr:ATP-binding cassette domain-containing protein [Prolixibacteraceae bacterium]
MKKVQFMDTQSSILIKNVNVFQREQLVLSNVNIEIAKGEFVYLVGKVGSGKSSLIKILNAEIPVFQGNVTVSGFDVDRISRKDIPMLRRKIGVVFQDFKLLTDRNVYKNLLFVLKATGWKDVKVMDSRIEEILNEVGMLHASKKMPHQLSGGEQQRVVIARALLNNPEIILADEPTGNLDHDTSTGILNLFKKINASGKTVLMATHDKLIIEKFPARTLVCDDGKVYEPEREMLNFRELL